ncbi:hypothetical protein RDI58_001225 [Solanum bulbocastanum]|uniref:Uncharacterized protein n=1 Tax=Solanum bulbocastanum TaxID=147425 RepID=A0AAN8UCB2_SOLBU
MDKHHKVNHRDAIMTILISSIAPQADVSLLSFEIFSLLCNIIIIRCLKMDKYHKIDRIDAIMVVPISSIAPQIGVSLVYLHLETNKMFRSLIEVYKFVVYGEVPEITKKSRENEETLQVTPRRK